MLYLVTIVLYDVDSCLYS